MTSSTAGRAANLPPSPGPGGPALGALLDSAPVAVLATDLQWRVLAWNRAAERLFGWSAAEIVGSRVPTIPEREQAAASALRAAALRGEPLTVSEGVRRRKDGSLVEVELSVAPLRGAGGAIEGVITTATDLAPRRRADALLRESEERYRTLVELSPDMIAVHQEVAGERVVTFVNPAGVRLLGGSRPEEIVGQPLYRFFEPDFHPVADERLARLVAGETLAPTETRFVRLDGSLVEVEMSGAPTRYLGGPAIQLVARDVSGRKRAEHDLRETSATLQALLDSAPVAVVAADRDGLVTLWNPAAEAMYGWQAGEVLGRPIRHVPEEGLGRYRDERRRVGSGEVLPAIETTRVRKDGTRVEVQISKAPIRDAAGEITGIMAVAVDIGERKHAERLAADQQRILEMVAGGQPLSAVLDGLVRLAERHAEGMLCSVLLLDDEGRLRHGAAPSLPASYCEAIDGASIGPSAGSCGTAAYRGSAVIVRDIATDPLWADYRDLALPHGLRACWSTPILAKDGTVLGTFAMYYGEPLDPTPAHRALIEAVTQIAGIAIQRARDEEELRGAEERYRTLVEQVPAIVYTCRPGAGGDWLYVSPQVEEILGFTPEEWLAMERPWQERVHPEDRPRALELEAQVLAGGRPLSVEYRMLRRDGETVWISDQAWVARDEHGTPVLRHGFLTDVTARKRAEQALRDSEERFRSIFESASVGIAITEVPSGRILRVNHAFEQLVERTEAELFGVTADAFTHPDDLPRKLELFEELLRGERESMRLVNRYLRPDGTVVVGDATGSLVRDESGTPISYVGLVTDVTEQRRAEEARREATEQLRAVIEASPLAILALDRAGFVRLWNPAATRLFGWTAEEVLGRTLPTVPEGLREEFDRHREQALLGTEIVRLETRRLHRDGTPIDVALFLAPLYGPEGEIAGHITLVEDIRASKQAEEERRRLEVQMQQAQRLESLGVLAGGIAHDFNNLLMAVMGNAGLAMLDVPPGPAYERIEQIQVAAERAADLTNQLLAYAGRASVQVEPVDVSVLVREMATLLEVSIPKKVALRLDLDDRLPAIEGDRAQLRQVVMNLITNAAEAVDGAEGTIALRTAVEELGAATLARAVGGADLEPGRYVCVTVEDTGSGMDEETLAHIFESFFTTKFAGRGLGLAAVLGIVRAHGGGILVDAAPGRGTTFRVLFPASDRAAELAAAPRAGEVTRRLSVLVVDDEPTVRGVARAMLERLGHTVLVAEHGEEALALVRGGAEPDLVLLDMTMPVMDGRETLRALREVRPGLPVLLSSGYAEAGLAGDGERWTGFVQKPYTPSALAEAIEAALEAAGGAAAPR